MKRNRGYRRKNRRSKNNSRLWLTVGAVLALVLLLSGLSFYIAAVKKEQAIKKPDELIAEYMDCIEKKEYEAMYSMLDTASKEIFSKEGFIERNSKIYEGIQLRDMEVQNIVYTNQEKMNMHITYETSFETVAGVINFDNEAEFVREEDIYRLVWDDRIIFPDLSTGDKVKVTTQQAERGIILDRRGKVLAGKGIASSVGIVPGKLDGGEESMQKLAELLNMDVESIHKKLQAKWIKEDSFVPIKTISKITELDLMNIEASDKMQKEIERQEQLLLIPGIMITDVEVRAYEMKEAAAHLIGYTQNVTAEDLEKHTGEGYNANSVIGRTGMEGLFEKELKGKDGHEIYIVNEDGEAKKYLANQIKEDGKDIRLTIDASLQRLLYEQFKEEPGCSAALNPYTGEVLALVSTPSYDDNDFIRGIGTGQWNSLNEDDKRPLYNRFRQTWCPGSAFKPITAAIGLDTGSIKPEDNFGGGQLSWQKDDSWGDYFVTTLHTYEPGTLENALVYSDNIYFAQAALQIGADNFTKYLDSLWFNKELPFEITMSASQYSNSEKIETEIQLADSGYGQGQILVNPLHLASIYTAFINGGDIIKPYLLHQQEQKPEVWIPQAFSKDAVQMVLEGLKKTVNDPEGTGYGAHMEDLTLAGKTGTAELKTSKEDTMGTEIGWFTVFTADENTDKPVLIVSMVENVKEEGGSGYVVKKVRNALDTWFSQADW